MFSLIHLGTVLLYPLWGFLSTSPSPGFPGLQKLNTNSRGTERIIRIPLKKTFGYRINQPANTALQKFQYGSVCGLLLTDIDVEKNMGEIFYMRDNTLADSCRCRLGKFENIHTPPPSFLFLFLRHNIITQP